MAFPAALGMPAAFLPGALAAGRPNLLTAGGFCGILKEWLFRGSGEPKICKEHTMDQETFEKEASADAGRAESPSPAGRPVHEPGGPSAEGDRIAGQAPANASTNGQAAFSGENAPDRAEPKPPARTPKARDRAPARLKMPPRTDRPLPAGPDSPFRSLPGPTDSPFLPPPAGRRRDRGGIPSGRRSRPFRAARPSLPGRARRPSSTARR